MKKSSPENSGVENKAVYAGLSLIRSAIVESDIPFFFENPNRSDSKKKIVIFVSVSNGFKRSSVAIGIGNSFEAAWQISLAKMKAIFSKKREWRWIKIDIVHSVRSSKPSIIKDVILNGRKNYFRNGISFDENFNTALLEQELNGIAAIGLNNEGLNAIRFNKINSYLNKNRKNSKLPINVEDRELWYTFQTTGFFYDRNDPSSRVHILSSGGFSNGIRNTTNITVEIQRLIGVAGTYLANQLLPDGRFIYGYFPVTHTLIPTYNVLRHCSTLYAMLEAWEVTGISSVFARVGEGIDYILRESLYLKDEAAFVVDQANGGEVKLGAQATLILAITKYTSLTGDARYISTAQAVAHGIVERFLDKESGQFVHVLQDDDLLLKAKFRIVYYDGEAVLALLRLYALDSDLRWLESAKIAFEHFVSTGHWKHHDHWLAYCTNEITQFLPDDRYYEFGLKNVFDNLDFIHHRDTAYPTFLEMLMASLLMIRSMIERGRGALLASYNVDKLVAAIHHRAKHQINSHFYPEMAMYFEKPLEIVGSFFIRHHAFRIRIDDVEHFISGFCLYLRHVLQSGGGDCLSSAQVAALIASQRDAKELPSRWSADLLTVVAQGKWVKPPPPGWAARGICAWLPSRRPGDIVVVKSKPDEGGIPPERIAQMVPPPLAIMTAGPVGEWSIPTFSVSSTPDAILAMGHYARTRMTGRVIGVTGSVGKTTTVAMLTHVLGVRSDAHLIAQSANLPLGTARVLASMPWDDPFNVIEMAVGRMGPNSRLARPDVALITNIRPAHLIYHHSTTEIARRKAAIFLGMKPGSPVIIHRDDPEWHLLQEAADLHGLKAYSYGSDDRSDFRLLAFNPEECRARGQIAGRMVDYSMAAPGKHMALNGLAVLAVVSVLDLPIDAAITQLGAFESLPGRGQQVRVTIDGRRLTLIDDTFNANPSSMTAALDLMANLGNTGGRKIVVLGDMLELGSDEIRFHRELAPAVGRVGAAWIALCGPQMNNLAVVLEEEHLVDWYPDVASLQEALISRVVDGDILLLKSSSGTNLSKIVALLKSISEE